MPEPKRPLKVFLCHATADKPKVRELYRYLKKRGIQPWLDAENLLPGQNWQTEIPKAIETSDVIIICLSKDSVDKEGYVQKEIKFALDKALEMPEGRIFIIPVRLDECEVPYGLKKYQWVDLFDEDGYSRLMKSLKKRASQLERTTVQVSKQDEYSSYLVEKPKQESREGVSVHVNGDVKGNIIIGNENSVQNPVFQPVPEKMKVTVISKQSLSRKLRVYFNEMTVVIKFQIDYSSFAIKEYISVWVNDEIAYQGTRKRTVNFAIHLHNKQMPARIDFELNEPAGLFLPKLKNFYLIINDVTVYSE